MEENCLIHHPDGTRLYRRGTIDLKDPQHYEFLHAVGSEYESSKLYWVEYRRTDSKTLNIGFALQSTLESDPQCFRVGSLYQYPRDEGVVWHIAGSNHMVPIGNENPVLTVILEGLQNACAESPPMWMITRRNVIKDRVGVPNFLRDWVIKNHWASRLMAAADYSGIGGTYNAFTPEAAVAYVLRQKKLNAFFEVDADWLQDHANAEHKRLIGAIAFAHSEYVKTGAIGNLDELLSQFEDLKLQWMR